MYARSTLVTICLMWLWWPVWAQQSSSDIIFKHLSVESGLPSATISCLLKSKSGVLWIGTHSGGVARFDGQRLKAFPLDGVFDIINLVENSNGDLYMGTNKGLYVLRHDAMAFESLHIPALAHKPEGCWTNPLYIDHDQKLWLSLTCVWGLYTLDLKSLSLVKISDQLSERVQIFSQQPFAPVQWCLSVASEGVDLTEIGPNYQVERHRKGLVKYIDGQKVKVAHHFTPENDSVVWLGTNVGLIRWNRFNGRQHIFNRYAGRQLTNLTRPSIINDSTLAVGSETEGLLFFSLKKQCFTHQWRYHATMPQGLSSNDITQVVSDGHHIFVVTPRYGLDYAALQPPIFKAVFNKKQAFEAGFSNNDLICAIQSRGNTIYAGTLTAGIVKIEPSGHIAAHPINSRLNHKTVNALAITDDTAAEALLVGSNDGLQWWHQGKATTILGHEPVYHIAKFNKTTYFISTFNNVYSLSLLKNQPRLKAVAGVSQGAHRYNWSVFFDAAHRPFALLEYGSLVAALEPTADEGWRLGRSVWLPIIAANDTPSVSGDIARFCTHQGLLYLNLKDFSLRKETQLQGERLIQSHKIIDIDGQNHWVLTDKSVFYVSPHQVRYANASDGLASILLVPKACLVLSDGRLFLGGNNGGRVLKKEASTIPEQSQKSIIFTEIGINDSLFLRLSDPFLHLSFHQNTVAFSFAATDFSLPNQWVLEYRLKNFDDHWLAALPSATVRYGHLPEGNYVFEVRYRNNGHTLKQIWIRIEPPFYRTLWFIGIVITAFLAGLALYLAKIRQKMAAKMVFEHMKIAAENKALRAQMNPHFIFNCINTIDGYVLSNQPLQASAFLQKFSKLVRLVLENSQHEKILLETDLLALDLYMQLESERFSNSFETKIDIDASVAPEKLWIAPLIIQPFVENAIVHGLRPRRESGGVVVVRLYKEGTMLRVHIDDNGVGRAAAAQRPHNKADNHKSRGIALTQERLRWLESMYAYQADFYIEDKEKGTEVGFLLPFDDV